MHGASTWVILVHCHIHLWRNGLVNPTQREQCARRCTRNIRDQTWLVLELVILTGILERYSQLVANWPVHKIIPWRLPRIASEIWMQRLAGLAVLDCGGSVGRQHKCFKVCPRRWAGARKVIKFQAKGYVCWQLAISEGLLRISVWCSACWQTWTLSFMQCIIKTLHHTKVDYQMTIWRSTQCFSEGRQGDEALLVHALMSGKMSKSGQKYTEADIMDI